ncbi:hypothetical protein LCGC14_0312900 [marine sediment metagenome]|uniref:Uncharacterized protein n=1 Tax=marine sediment metagenome TaxID=412755 RepID=A0A0F9WT70_9ZZZZ
MGSESILLDLIEDVKQAITDEGTLRTHLVEIVANLEAVPDRLTGLTQGQDTLPDHERRLDAAIAAIARVSLLTMSNREIAVIVARAYVGFRP